MKFQCVVELTPDQAIDYVAQVARYLRIFTWLWMLNVQSILQAYFHLDNINYSVIWRLETLSARSYVPSVN